MKTLNTLQEITNELHDPKSLDRLIEMLGDKQVVMLGEASHGTSEYYLWRSVITKNLIEKHGFNFIAVEGDWPDCYRINRYIKGYDDAGNSMHSILKKFSRWPTWMWANKEIEQLGEWLNRHNYDISDKNKTGFYGLDVYSLWDSIEAVVEYLEEVDEPAAEKARNAYRCFEAFGYDEDSYAYGAYVPKTCEEEVIGILKEIIYKREHFNDDSEAKFNAEQNAFVVKNAEKYYRTMFSGNAASWNLRDKHMMDTLHKLHEFHGKNSKSIIWAHNTHIGDASYTNMKQNGMFNIGQLAREEMGRDNVALVGFGSYEGSVIAGEAWDAPAEVMAVPKARKDSWEQLLHETGDNDQIIFSEDALRSRLSDEMRGHRAIGVVYDPEYDHMGNYVPTDIVNRYDAFIYINSTSALHPVHTIDIDRNKLPESYPFSY